MNVTACMLVLLAEIEWLDTRREKYSKVRTWLNNGLTFSIKKLNDCMEKKNKISVRKQK